MSSKIDTRTARIEVVEDRIVVARVGDKVQSVDDARDNIGAAARLASPDLKPLLIDMRAARPLLPEVRQQYSGERLDPFFSAMALLVRGNPLGLTMANIYLKIARPAIPTKIFVQERKALAWLRGRK